MKVLVIGGTGTTGSQVVKDLLARGVDVHVLTRSADKKMGTAHMCVGDLRNPYEVAPYFQDVERIFMLIAAGTTESYEGVLAVKLASRARVKRFVYMSSQKIDQTQDLIFGGATKLPIENALKLSGIGYSILRPNSFYQNDVWYKDALLKEGIYPQPIGPKGMSRVDVRDISQAACATLLEYGHEGKTYNIVGPDIQTGRGIAEVWSRALKTPIQYGGDDLDKFEETHAFMGPSLVFPYRLYFEWYQANGLHASEEDLQIMNRLLGRNPRSHADFAKECAEAWK